MDEDEYIRKEKRREQKAKWAKKKRDALRIVSVLEEVRRRPLCADAPGNSAPGPSNPVNDVSSPVNLDSCDGTSDEEGSTDHAVHVEVDEETVTEDELFERQLQEIFGDSSPNPTNRVYNASETGSPDGNAYNYSSTSDEDGDNEEGDDVTAKPNGNIRSSASPGYDTPGPASPSYDTPGPASPGYDTPDPASPGYDTSYLPLLLMTCA
ncbi:uncharacterized protein LOC119733718 [Patiria miniata]|uniref:Uncharacterized protein n=1 Tax=Patiria miniata TaxID=46514 RepID=A0A914AI15_PATMI|nr:uncharacterized protein LOC119733718 [Patiria miniata]